MRGMSETLVVTSIHAMAKILDVHSVPHPGLEEEDIGEWVIFASELEAACRHSWTMKGVRQLYVDE